MFIFQFICFFETIKYNSKILLKQNHFFFFFCFVSKVTHASPANKLSIYKLIIKKIVFSKIKTSSLIA